MRGPGLSGGRAARSNRCRFCMGDSRKNFDQVRKKCAEPELVCMVVSRFLKFPIQMNLSEKDFSHHRPLGRVFDPSGVGGYMRKRRIRELKSD